MHDEKLDLICNCETIFIFEHLAGIEDDNEFETEFETADLGYAFFFNCLNWIVTKTLSPITAKNELILKTNFDCFFN